MHDAKKRRGQRTLALTGQSHVWDARATMAAQMALPSRQEQELYRALIAQSPDAIFIVQHGEVVYRNGTHEHWFGVPLAETACPNLSAFAAPEDRQRVQAYDQVLRQGERMPEPCAMTLRSQEGRCLCLEAWAQAITYQGFPATVVVLRDLPQRPLVDDALCASEGRYRDLYEAAPHAYFSVGVDGRILQANRQAVALLGYALDDLLGRPVLSLYAETPAGKARAQQVWQQFRAGQEVRGVEVEMRRADGAHIWGSLSVCPIRNAHGTIVATRSMVVDITARRHAEAALRTSEARLTRILDTAIDAILTVDAQHRITLFNAAAEQMFRCTAAEALGQPLARFCTPPLSAYFRTYAQCGTASCAAWIPEGFHARRADGEVFPVEGTFSHVPLPEQPLSTIILRDLQARKHAEASLRTLRREHRYLQEELNTAHNFEEIIGTSAALQRVLQHVEQVAGTDATVLITGETGTGKELIVRALHHRSARRDRPLIKVNCTALPSGLIESELFGHEKGAFTGALARRIGRFELADGGTLFLDEIGEIPLEVQAKLLRVLQDHAFERVGGSCTRTSNVRVIAATNRDLYQAVVAHQFRADLYYRLHVFPIHLPPLRERTEDIPLLTRYFVDKYGRQMGKRLTAIAAASLARLVEYPWPGNIRELEHLIERAVILTHGPTLVIDDTLLSMPTLPLNVSPVSAAPVPASAAPTLAEVERRYIVQTLEKTRWVVEGPKGAARLLNLHPNTLRGRMRRLGITRAYASAACGAS